MEWIGLASVLLLVGCVGVIECRKFTDADKEKIMTESKRWESPKIDEIVESNVSKHGTVYRYSFKYKNTEEKKVCTVEYREKKKVDGMHEGQVKWKCKVDLPDDPDYHGEDYNRRHIHIHKKHKTKKS